MTLGVLLRSQGNINIIGFVGKIALTVAVCVRDVSPFFSMSFSFIFLFVVTPDPRKHPSYMGTILAPKSATSPRTSGFFLGRRVLETKMQELGVLTTQGVSTQSQDTHAHISVSWSVRVLKL